MRSCGPFLLLGAVLAGTPGCDPGTLLSETAPFREEFSYSYPLEAGAVLTLENFNGPVEIMGWEKDEIRVSGIKHAPKEEDLRQLKIEVAAERHSVRIRTVALAGRRSGCGARYLVRVPKRIELDSIVTSNGSVRVEDIQGPARMGTSNGSIRLRQIAGRVEARTSNGTVTASDLEGEARLRSSNGGITV
ncbi:MAG: hypothetical protein ACP5U2_07725, partial [Bryobacteraceae bacterium]